MDTIKRTVEIWIAEDELPTKAGLRPVSRFDNRYGYQRTDLHGVEAEFDNELSEIEEAEAYWDFMHWAMSKEHLVLLSIPKPEAEFDFWPFEFDEKGNDMSAFNTIDFQRLQQPFNSYHYRLRKVYERVKDLAETHASISDIEGKENTFQRFKVLVENEFRDRAIELQETYKKYKVWCDKQRLMSEIENLNRQIRKCKKIWRDNAYLP